MLEIKKGGSNKERKKIRVEESYKGGSLTVLNLYRETDMQLKINKNLTMVGCSTKGIKCPKKILLTVHL